MANGILLCWHHHAHVHQRHIEIHRRGKRWVFTDQNGRVLTDPTEHPSSDSDLAP